MPSCLKTSAICFTSLGILQDSPARALSVFLAREAPFFIPAHQPDTFVAIKAQTVSFIRQHNRGTKISYSISRY